MNSTELLQQEQHCTADPSEVAVRVGEADTALGGLHRRAGVYRCHRHGHPADPGLLGSFDCSNSAAGTEIFRVVWRMFGLWQVKTWHCWRLSCSGLPLNPLVPP